MTLAKKIILGFIACGVILFCVSVFTFANSEKFIDSNSWVEHTHKVLYEFEQIQALSVDCETGSRGYVISGKETFLEPFEKAKGKINEHLALVNELTIDNPVQQKKVRLLEAQIAKHLVYLDNLTEVVKVNIDEARKIVSSGQGKRITDSIRVITADAVSAEQKLLAERKISSERDANNFTLVFSILLTVIAIILTVVYFIITTNLKALRKAEKETAEKNWILTGNSRLNDEIQGEKEVNDLANDVIALLCIYLNAQLGSVYLAENEELSFAGGYAYDYKGKEPA
ncbi:MAG TPA: CHASE3 domain-containing protein, partial [Bacteroidia bacterium]